jgi:histidyl-tRNA synthetase
MNKFRNIKGTKDLLPEELVIWKHVEKIIHSVMFQNGFGEIRTPVFENTDLFIRGIGTDTDIVSKEMYSWKDQGNNTLTLRPELTAPVARAYIQHQLVNQNPMHRLYYMDSLFRRERPQKGRQRQFHQFGAEAIGSPNPEQDAEIIALAYNIFKKFNIKDIKVNLNSIGSPEIRNQYLKLLRLKLADFKLELCKICQIRIKKNALRLFDCKNSKCQKLLDQNAPLIFDEISDSDFLHFDVVMRILNKIGIPFSHNKKLVRGLDYYSHTTFEITSKELGAQDALCGGGRYNGLIEQLGGKPTPAVGFAAGLERLIIALDKSQYLEEYPDIYFVHLGEPAIVIASKIANDLRMKHGKTVIFEVLRRSLKAQMREAGRSKAKLALILGDDELSKNKIIIRDMYTGNQEELDLSKLDQYFTNSSN